MGKSYTPTYRVEYRDQTGKHMMAWDGKQNGRANAKNLERWRKSYNESFQPGQVNEQVADLYGFIPHISHAWLVHQKTGQIVAKTTMPMFEVV